MRKAKCLGAIKETHMNLVPANTVVSCSFGNCLVAPKFFANLHPFYIYKFYMVHNSLFYL